jgi:hypothetical protein
MKWGEMNELSLQATENFWENFYDLTPSQKESTRRAWKIFKQNPFDPRLRPHKINRLSVRRGRTIYAVDLRTICVSCFISNVIAS